MTGRLIKKLFLVTGLVMSAHVNAAPDYMFNYLKTTDEGERQFVFLANLQGICDPDYAKCDNDAEHFAAAQRWARLYGRYGLGLKLDKIVSSRWVTMGENGADAVEITFSLVP